MTSRLRVALAVLTVSTAAAVLGAAAPAMAAVSCPNSNPVVNENNCMGAGSQGWRIGNYSEDIAGYTTKTSFAKGENVQLKIARNAPILPQTHVDISVYRTGYYGGEGARLIPGAGATNVAVNNNFTCNPANATTGELSCANWGVTFTIPGSALPASGVYVAKLRTTDTNVENRVVFVVRDDGRVPEARVLLVLPTTTYLAYNTWGGKSLYFDKNGGANTVSGTPRAVKVSFDRPLDGNESDRDRYFGPDFQTVQWLEQQGYDVAYTDDVRAHVDPAELLEHKVLVIPGHSEYWSREEFLNFKAARDAGVSIASFSANTAYWKVRYENATRSIVCFKTVQGDGSSGSGHSGDGSTDDKSGSGSKGSDDSGSGTSGSGTSGSDDSSDGTSGSGTSGSGTSGSGTSGDGTSGSGTSGDGTSGSGTSGDGSSGSDASDDSGSGSGSSGSSGAIPTVTAFPTSGSDGGHDGGD